MVPAPFLSTLLILNQAAHINSLQTIVNFYVSAARIVLISSYKSPIDTYGVMTWTRILQRN